MANTHKELSIQITLGGFSFQINSPSGNFSGEMPLYDFDSAIGQHYNLSCDIQWSVPRVLIVPFEIFDHSCIDQYLLSAGMMQKEGDRSMFAVRGEYVAVWAVDNALWEYLENRIPHAEHTHKLLSILAEYNSCRNTIVFDIDDTRMMNIAIWNDNGLQTALCAEVYTVEDVLFFCRRLSKADDLMEYNIICLDGVNFGTRSLLKTYYQNVKTTLPVCE